MSSPVSPRDPHPSPLPAGKGVDAIRLPLSRVRERGSGGEGRPRQLGVVLTPAEVQDEGLDRVLDNIAGTGATAISPTRGW